MEYTLERFELDMRKVDLYVENAVAAFNITADEASLYSESTEYDLIMTEASDGLGAKIKAAFTKIIESIKKFFSGLIDKIKSIFTKESEAKVKKVVASNPELGKQKIEVDDIKAIEKWCGKRKVLCAKLVKKAKAGTLTQDEFDRTVEQVDAMGAKMKTVGKIAIPVVTALAVIGGAVALISRAKKEGTETVDGVNDVNDKPGVFDSLKLKVAQLFAKTSTEDANAIHVCKTKMFQKVRNFIEFKIKRPVANTITATRLKYGKKGFPGGDSMFPDDDDDDDDYFTPGGAETETDAEAKAESVYDSDDFDLSDTFFDI